MQLDHVAYAVTNAELADTVQRLGAELGVAFIDGGKHPRAGTRNFILPLASGQYIEIVAPLEHPVAETVPFGQAVRNRAEAGGGWMGWALRVDDIAPLEARIGRSAGPGHRQRPGGTDLTWQQIGVIDLIAEPILPFFIKWDDKELVLLFSLTFNLKLSFRNDLSSMLISGICVVHPCVRIGSLSGPGYSSTSNDTSIGTLAALCIGMPLVVTMPTTLQFEFVGK